MQAVNRMTSASFLKETIRSKFMNKDEFLRNYLVDRRNTNSFKWDALEEKFGDQDLLPMWIADMEFKTPECVRNAMIKRIDHGVFGYSSVPDSYYEALSEWEEPYGYRVHKDWVRFTTGCITAIAWMLQAFTKPGDAVLILTPVYYPFHNVVTYNGRKLVTVDLKYDNGYFTMDYDAIEKAIAENDVRMFLQCSPHNPAGRVWKEEELERVLDICQRHDVLVVSDEIHQDITIEGNHFISAAGVSGGKYQNNLVIVNSPSKTFNLASLLHSHIIIPDPDLRKIFDEWAKGMNRTENNVLGLTAAEAAYRGGREWHDALMDVIESNYHYLKEHFAEELPEVTVCALEGTYLPMLDLRAVVSPDQLKHVVQDECCLAVDYGDVFGECCRGFIRLNIATDPEFVKVAASRLIHALKK